MNDFFCKSGLWLTLLFAFTASAFAQPKISLEEIAEADVVVDEGGKKVTKLVVVDTIEPGQEIFYTLTFANTGNETAYNINLNNKIPENTSYQAGSVWGENAAVTFSIDDGNAFAAAEDLLETVEIDGRKQQRPVAIERYTDIAWLVAEIAAGGKGSVGFTAVVK